MNEYELIIKIPLEYARDFETQAKQAGFKNSKGQLLKFIKRQLALFYDKEETEINIGE